MFEYDSTSDGEGDEDQDEEDKQQPEVSVSEEDTKRAKETSTDDSSDVSDTTDDEEDEETESDEETRRRKAAEDKERKDAMPHEGPAEEKESKIKEEEDEGDKPKTKEFNLKDLIVPQRLSARSISSKHFSEDVQRVVHGISTMTEATKSLIMRDPNLAEGWTVTVFSLAGYKRQLCNYFLPIPTKE